MTRVFAVMRTKGPSWNHAVALEEHDDWRTHAEFMNGLCAEKFVLLGGPLEGTSNVLLIIRARDENEIRDRLSADSWTTKELPRITQIAPWTIRLGAMQ